MPSHRPTAIALLSASLPLQLRASPDVQLLPAGRFAARDGRPGPGMSWTISDARGHEIAQALNAQAASSKFLFDVDHQTIRAEENGQPAPAAGWATSFEWRAGKGLYALNVQWTDQARAWIESGQYAYISPVITYDESGQVTGVLMAAITNYPAVLGMDPLGDALAARLAARPEPQKTTTTKEPLLMDLLTQLLALLGLPDGADAAAALGAITALKDKAGAAPAAPGPVSAAVATALGVDATADEAAALSAIAKLKQPAGADGTTAVIAALQGQVAALSAKLAGDEVDKLVEGAIAARKLLPVQRSWATELGRRNVADLKAYLATAPALLPGIGGQSGGVDPTGSGGDAAAALSSGAASVLATMGVKADDWKKVYGGAPAA